MLIFELLDTDRAPTPPLHMRTVRNTATVAQQQADGPFSGLLQGRFPFCSGQVAADWKSGFGLLVQSGRVQPLGHQRVRRGGCRLGERQFFHDLGDLLFDRGGSGRFRRHWNSRRRDGFGVRTDCFPSSFVRLVAFGDRKMSTFITSQPMVNISVAIFSHENF